MNTETKTIKVDITWRAAARIYIEGLEHGTPEGKQAAREGIMEMADKLDALKAERESAIDMDKIAGDASDAADALHTSATRDARKVNCRIYSRGFEFLSLNADGERDENVIDYCERDEMDAGKIAEMIEDVRKAGSAYLAIGYGVDAAETQADYDAGDYEPMFDWVDLPDVDVRC